MHTFFHRLDLRLPRRAPIGLVAWLLLTGCGASIQPADAQSDAAREAAVTDDAAPPDASADRDATPDGGGSCATSGGLQPCAIGHYCYGSGGAASGCEICWCDGAGEPAVCSGIGCSTSPPMTDAGPPLDSGPLDCDLDTVFGPAHGTPTQLWCAAWREVWGVPMPGGVPRCVRLEFCRPLSCVPGYANSCPWDYQCNAQSGVCALP